MKTKPFNLYSSLISTAGLIVSLAAIAISIKTCMSSDAQFQYLNQGYLQVQPNIALDKDGKTLNRVLEVGDDERILGLSFEIDLLNAGNLPVNYTIKKFDVYFNGALVHTNLDNYYNDGVLYPKQTGTYNIPTLFFNSLKLPARFGDLKLTDYKCRVVIEYSDFGSKHIKIIDREYKTELFNGGLRISYIKFRDSI